MLQYQLLLVYMQSVQQRHHLLHLDISLLVGCDGFLVVGNKFHPAVVHFECLLNVHKPPIFNEVVKLKQVTVHLEQIPFTIQQIFLTAVHIRNIPVSHQPFIVFLNDFESLVALYELDQTTRQVIFEALLENPPIVWQSHAFVMCLDC